MRLKKIVYKMLGLGISCVMLINLSGCAQQVKADDLMKEVKPESVTGKDSDDEFVKSQMDFSVELFKNSILESKEENILISPTSVMLALAMTANGADGETKAEMEKALAGDLTIEELNEYLYSYVEELPSMEKSKLEIANSIWFRDDLNVEKNFLQTNANYYNASAYKSPFSEQTVKDINNWVSEKTNKMIEKIINEVGEDTVMYLINAVMFDAEWMDEYNKGDISDGIFTSYNGDIREVEMMNSTESRYIEDGKATGFIKDYKNGKYSFVALLPNEDIDILQYIEEFSSEAYLEMMNNVKSDSVVAALPKFSYDYGASMNDVLKRMGINKAFGSETADFSKLGSSSRGNIYIGNVIHKTFISVDELGTKAGAVTAVVMDTESMAEAEKKVVKLDRPFVYMIIEKSTNLPIFMGAVMDIEE